MAQRAAGMAAVFGVLWGAFAAPALAAPGEITGRIEVVDGDTLRVGGQTIRLHGIDAPELDQSCTRRATGAAFACGQWVRDRTVARFENARATCTRIDTDRYGRTVARCRAGGEDVAAHLVAEGLAFAYRRYSTRYVAQERRAAAENRGLHAARVQNPAAFRRQGTKPAASPTGCAIKGNISANGRIYHLPGQEHYARTRINTAKGERWFCTEAAAQQAGWRRARR